MKTFRSLSAETFVCSCCKRKLDKKYLYKWGMCADCVADSQKNGKPALASSAPGNMALEKEVKFEQRLGLRPGESLHLCKRGANI